MGTDEGDSNDPATTGPKGPRGNGPTTCVLSLATRSSAQRLSRSNYRPRSGARALDDPNGSTWRYGAPEPPGKRCDWWNSHTFSRRLSPSVDPHRQQRLPRPEGAECRPAGCRRHRRPDCAGIRAGSVRPKPHPSHWHRRQPRYRTAGDGNGSETVERPCRVFHFGAIGPTACSASTWPAPPASRSKSATAPGRSARTGTTAAATTA
jgi:hypothetical protein